MNPFFIKNQELALEQMSRYLLNNDERSLLKKASKKKKEKLYLQNFGRIEIQLLKQVQMN